MATVVVVHGAWSAGWAWRKLRPLAADAGWHLVVPTLTGLGERSHLAHPGVDLETHITDIVNVLEYEDLSEVVLLAHSYGGMVATGAAHRAATRVAGIVYLDAFVPQDGQCLLDLIPDEVGRAMRLRATQDGQGWRVAPNPLPPDTSAADVAWIEPRRGFQPLATFTQPLRLGRQPITLPRAYVYCTRIASGDVFRPFADHARTDPSWTYREIDASHSPHVTAPSELMGVVRELMA